ncbi:histidine phosphatase family protein [Candidatus Woesebacteria bacterium]|nr:histidine phosphatase family protein [Candidatus Woesebacteria bacterium]
MSTIYLLRHGQRVSRDEDTLLSEIGVRQATLTAHYLQDKQIASIHASPLKRTQQTAQIINEKLQLPIINDERLLERMVFDAERDDTFDEFLKMWDATTSDRDFQPPYGDSARASGDRLKSVLDELADNSVHLIVSHGGVIGDFLRNLFSDEKLPFRSHPSSTLKWVEISECSVTEVQKQGGVYSLRRANDTSHLL